MQVQYLVRELRSQMQCCIAQQINLKKKKMKVGILFNTTLSSIDYLFCKTNVEYLSQIKYTHSLNTFITINYNIIISPSKDLEIP